MKQQVVVIGFVILVALVFQSNAMQVDVQNEGAGQTVPNPDAGNSTSKQMHTYTITSTVPDVQISLGGSITVGQVTNSGLVSDKVDKITFQFPGNITYVIPQEKLNRDVSIDVDKAENGGYRITLSENKEEFFVPIE